MIPASGPLTIDAFDRKPQSGVKIEEPARASNPNHADRRALASSDSMGNGALFPEACQRSDQMVDIGIGVQR
jgi:hypothetical protein